MKRLLSLLLATLLLFTSLTSFVSCHGKRETVGFELPDGLEEGKTYEITFWAKNDSNPVQVALYEQCIADFEALYPNIKVKLRRYSDYGQIYNDVITNIATGTTPNVCITYPDHIATYMTGENVVVPLDSLIADEKYGLGGSEIAFDSPSLSEMVEKFLDEGKIGGVQYALPFMRSTEACYVNKTYVEALTGEPLPEILTWDYIFEVSALAMADEDGDGLFDANGQEVMIPCIYKSTDNMMIQMLRQRSADYSDGEGNILIFNDETKEILYTVADAAENKSFSTFKISSYPGNFFNRGRCLFAIDSTAGSTWMGSDAPLVDIPRDEVAEFETAVLPVPQYDTENPAMISQGPSLCLFNKEDPSEVLASWIFMQYLLTDGMQTEFSKTEGYVPVTERALQSEEYLDYLSRSGEDNDEYYSVKIDTVRMLIENIDNTFVTPVFNGSTSLRNAAGQMIEEVVKAKNRKKTVDDAFLEKLFADMSSLYHLGEGTEGAPVSGELPIESVLLLSGLGAVWLAIGGYNLYLFIKRRRERTDTDNS